MTTSDDMHDSAAMRVESEATMLRRALEALVDRLDLVHADPQFRSVWTIAQLHGQPYAGLTYTNVLEAARVALASPFPTVTPAPVGEVLLPCPFCGKEPALRDYDWPHKPAYMNCDDCGVVLDAGDGTPAEVIAAWNRRTPPPDASGEAVAVSDEAVEAAIENWSRSPHSILWWQLHDAIKAAVPYLYPASALAAAEARGVREGLERAAHYIEYGLPATAAVIRSLSPAHKGGEK